MQAKRITYDHKRRLEATVKSDIIHIDKRVAYLDLDKETISFVTSDIPIQVLRDIVANWDANKRASLEAFPEEI